jgi:CBS domain-containing protein
MKCDERSDEYSSLKKGFDMATETLSELLTGEVDSIGASEHAVLAKRRMDTMVTRSLLVTEGDQVVGIVRRNTLIDKSDAELERPVAEFMTRDFPTFRKDQSPQEAHDSLAGDINTEQIPVLDEQGAFIGVVNRNQLTGAMEPVGGTTHGEHAVSQLPLEDGMTVKDADGSKLGTLAEGDFKADGGVEFIIVEHGMVFKHQKRLPGDVVNRVEDGDLILSITSTEFSMINDIDD